MILFCSFLTELKYKGKCKPSWLSLELRAAFYMECLERFDFDGLVRRVQSDVRSMNEIAIDYRIAELKSAETSVLSSSSITSLVGLPSRYNQRLIYDAAKNSENIKKDVGFLEELMTIYLASVNEAWPALTFNQKMMRYLSTILKIR